MTRQTRLYRIRRHIRNHTGEGEMMANILTVRTSIFVAEEVESRLAKVEAELKLEELQS